MSKYSIATLDRVVELMLDGTGAEAARKMVGVSHTPAELHVFKFQWLVADLPEPGKGEWAFSTSLVNYLRFEATDDRGKLGWGIGKIMVALDATEGKVRKAIREGGTEDRGHRTGKGGRYFADNAKLYEDTLRTDGTRIPAGKLAEANTYAEVSKLLKRDFNELKEEAIEAGLIKKGQRGLTPAKVAMLLANA